MKKVTIGDRPLSLLFAFDPSFYKSTRILLGGIKYLRVAIDLRAFVPNLVSLFMQVNTSSPILTPRVEYCYRCLCPRCT